jgi:hypothetical protein
VTDADLIAFYHFQVQHVREFAKNHPSLTYIEIQLENDDNGRILEEATGVSRECWGHSNVNKRYKSETDGKSG